MSSVTLRHARIDLALHQLRGGSSHPLLLLHGLGERTPGEVPPLLDGWTGPVWGLDFTGHGESSVPLGGGYTAEVLMADVDTALGHLGLATIVGRGLGAYIGLLLAGARPDLVKGLVLADGPGLSGGGIRPGSPHLVAPVGRAERPDPFALAELSRDVRPPDYATTFARQILQRSTVDAPIAVTAVMRPEWLAAVASEPGVLDCPVPDALTRYSS